MMVKLWLAIFTVLEAEAAVVICGLGAMPCYPLKRRAMDLELPGVTRWYFEDEINGGCYGGYGGKNQQPLVEPTVGGTSKKYLLMLVDSNLQ